MLHILAVRNRKYLLADISALSSIIIALGGLKALEETMQAIQDVGQWWPWKNDSFKLRLISLV